MSSQIARFCRSESAAKTLSSSSSEYLTTRFSIGRVPRLVKSALQPIARAEDPSYERETEQTDEVEGDRGAVRGREGQVQWRAAPREFLLFFRRTTKLTNA